MPTSGVAAHEIWRFALIAVSVVTIAAPAAAQSSGEETAPAPATTFPATVAPPSAAGPAPKVTFEVHPYAQLVSSTAYVLGNSSNTPDLPEWAVEGPSALYWTARWSRFGLRASWDKPPSELGAHAVFGLLEADFNGAFLGQGTGYFLPIPRLRLATATVEWSSVRFSFGQDWTVLAPLNPETGFHIGVPGFTASGNLWGRIPQLRVDGAVALSDDTAEDALRLIWATALVVSVQTDAIPTDENGITNVRIPQGGERSLAPAGEARVAIAGPLFDKSFEVGLSGHVGNRKIAFTGGAEREMNGAAALDLTLPLPAGLKLAGELFWGTGVDAFSGGIGQGIAHTTDAAGAITSLDGSIATFGGWGQLSWPACSWLKLYGAGGFDNPHDGDLLGANAITNRTFNTAVYGSAAVELARSFVLWAEYDFLRTSYDAAPTVHTHTISLTGALTL